MSLRSTLPVRNTDLVNSTKKPVPGGDSSADSFLPLSGQQGESSIGYVCFLCFGRELNRICMSSIILATIFSPGPICT